VAEFALLFGPTLTAAPFGAHRPMIERYSDHAANERTFLAWLRTAIAIMAFGSLVQKFDLFLRILASSLAARPLTAGSQIVGDIAGLLLIDSEQVRLTKHFAQLLCEDARKLDQFRIYRLGASDDVGERRSRDLVLLIADQYAGLTIAQGFDGIDTQPRSQQAIEGAGRSAAHDVPQRRGTQLKTGPLLVGVEISEDLGGIFFDAFGNHDDCMRFATLECGAQPLRNLACRYLELRN
jgi:putative membrane protein